jgi:hypothetical protein
LFCSTYCTVATTPIEARGNQTEYAQRSKTEVLDIPPRSTPADPSVTEDNAAVGDKGSFISLSPLFQYIGTQLTPDLEESFQVDERCFLRQKDTSYVVYTPQSTLVPTVPMLHLCFSRIRVYPTLPYPTVQYVLDHHSEPFRPSFTRTNSLVSLLSSCSAPVLWNKDWMHKGNQTE